MTAAPQTTHELYQAAFAPRPELDAAEQARLHRFATATDVFTVVAGAWLLAAPTVLGYTAADRGGAGFWSTVAVAAAALVLAVVRAAAGTAIVVRSGGILLGAWLVVAPAVVGTGSRDGVVAGEVLAGLLLATLAAAGLRAMVVARRIG